MNVLFYQYKRGLKITRYWLSPFLHEANSEGLEGGVLIPHSRPPFRENPASPTFFISFPNPAFLSHKIILKSLIQYKS